MEIKNNVRISIVSVILLMSITLCAKTNDNVINKENATTTVLSKYITRPDAIISLDRTLFEEKIYNEKESPDKWLYIGDKPCIIDFYTTWCGPCRRLAPVLEQLAEKYSGLVYFYKADAEKEVYLSQKFGIRSYPSLVFCPQNGNPQIAIGALPKSELEKLISTILLK